MIQLYQQTADWVERLVASRAPTEVYWYPLAAVTPAVAWPFMYQHRVNPWLQGRTRIVAVSFCHPKVQ